ncbi:MAG TPA: alpha/beta hydrolase [Telluria sp.]
MENVRQRLVGAALGAASHGRLGRGAVLRAGMLALAAALSACAAHRAVSVAPVTAAPVAKDAPESYTAETTYAKLVRHYPFIRVVGHALPATVRVERDLTYVQHGGRTLQLDLYVPASPGAAPLPGIVFVHGGGWRSGVRENFAPIAIRMAEHGYAAATISYRLSAEARYPAAVQDAKAAVRWMRANAARYGIDPQRIAIGGASAGGQIAGLAGVSEGVARFEPEAGAVAGADGVSDAVQAIVNIDGLSDFTDEMARKYEDDPAKQPSSAGAWFGGRYAEKSASWREASPLFYVNPHTPPILFIGSAQPRFSVGREAMVEKMQALGIPTQVVLIPDTPHSFWLFDPWFEPTMKATLDFLDRNLRGRRAGS